MCFCSWSVNFTRKQYRVEGAICSQITAAVCTPCLSNNYIRRYAVNPSPPGLLAHPWVPGGGRITPPPPLLSREPLVVESRAMRHSKALHKTHQNHLSELNIEVKCEVKVRSKVKIWRFDVLGPGDQDYRTWWFKLRQNVVKGMVKVWYEYKWHTKKT